MEVAMAPIIDQPREDSASVCEPIPTTQIRVDVPGLMADRVGRLYAEEEYADRTVRTERLIREAQALQ
jgi:hypothetical protein